MNSDGMLGRDLRFDEFLILGAAETEAVVDLLAPVLDAGRQRARKETETENHNRTVGLVIANALLAGDQGVHYSRRYETYSGASPYKPEWLGSKRLIGVIDSLAGEGLVGALDGFWNGPFSKGAQSSFRVAPPLIEGLRALGIDRRAVRRDWRGAPAVVLKDHDDHLIRYDPSEEAIARQAGELRAYNAFIATQDISLSAEADAPHFHGLARIYNDSSWDRGGRHYGGWWQQLSPSQRSNILINGEQTVELDYGGFNPRALYHLTGQEVQGDDPYDIPKIKDLLENRGIDWQTKGRPAIKRILNIAISGKSKAAFFSPDSIKGISLPDDLIRLFVPIVIDHHVSIGDHLLKGLALDLMNIESNICHNIICDGMTDEVAILSIFDSFIIQKKNEDYLRQLMVSNYLNILNNVPVIH